MKRKFTLLMTALMLLVTNAFTAFGQTQYEKVTSAPATWLGEYLLVWEKTADSAYIWTGVDAANCYSYDSIVSGKITVSDAVSITVDTLDGGYSIKVNGGTNDGKYIYGTNNSNKINFGNTAVLNTLSYESSSVMIVSNTSVMRYNKNKNDNRFRYYKSTSYSAQQPVQLYKKVTGGDNVATPTFTPAGGTYYEAQNVTIDCATSGATIYYTIDGTTPTTESSVYSSPVAVSTTTTIKAMGVKSGMTNSSVATATYTFPTIMTIAEARALANNEYALVEGTVTLIDGRNVYVQDATAGIDLYLNSGTVPSTLALGDNVRAYGKKTVYNGLVELTGIDGSSSTVFNIISSGNPLPVVVKTIAEVIDDGLTTLQATRVKIENATIGAINTGGNTPLTQDANTVNIYKIPALTGIVQGDNVNVTAVVGCYNTVQLRVALASDVEKLVTTTVDTPTFTPAGGTYSTAQDVTIACTTDGATIYYTLDGTTPTTESTVYSSPIAVSTTTTIKAFAVKTGMNDSEVATATYSFSASIAADPTELAGFSYTLGQGPSTTQTFAVSGSNLTANATVTASTSFEISLTDGESFSAQNTITISETSFSNTDIYVRMKAGLEAGEYNETLVFASEGAETVNITVSGNVVEPQLPSEYVQVPDLALLENGAKVILAARYNNDENAFFAMTAATSGKPTGVEFTRFNPVQPLPGSYPSIPASFAEADSLYYWTVSINGSNYTFTNHDGDVLGYTSGTNFATGGDNTAWTIEYATADTTAMVPSHSAFVITNANSTGRAIALNSSHNFGPYAKSNMSSSNYNFYLDMFATEGGTPVCATPSFTPEGGTYYEVQTVAITSATEDATIYYTTDGTEPTTSSLVYSEPIEVAETMIIKAIAMKEDHDDSNVATAEYTIILGATTIFAQDWEGEMNGWTFVTVQGSKPWYVASSNDNHYAYANGYNGGANEQWCISPAFNIDMYSDVSLSFMNAKNYDGNDVQLFFSNDYDGTNAATATWTELTFEKSTGSWAWVESGVISLEGFTGTNCHIGYKYTCTETQASAWEIDNIIMVGFTSEKVLTVSPESIDGLTYIENYGPSAQQSFTVSGTNLLNNVTLTMAGTDFEMSSLSGDDFVAQPTITLTPTAGSIEQNIYVRLAADLDVDTYESSITITSELDDITVSLAGSVEEQGDNWNRIMSVGDITDGASVIIAARYNEVENEYFAMTASTSGKPEGVLFTSETEGANEILPIDIVMNESTFRWTVSVNDGVYTFTNAAGDTIGYGGSGTNFQSNGDNTTWTIDYILSDSESMVPNYWGFLITNTTSTTRAFAINNTYHSFGPYSTQNLTGGNASGYNFCVDIFVQGGEVTQTVMTPVISPASGTYFDDIDVTITCATAGASIHYTTDGSTPTSASPVYTGAIHISNDMTINAIGMKEGYVDSNVATAEYVIMNDVSIIMAQDWEDGMNGWQFVTVEGNKPWTVENHDANNYAKANGYGDDIDNEQWCISPMFNLTQFGRSNVTLNFKNATKFEGPVLELLFSNDFDGQDVASATWQPLEFNMSEGNYEWAESGDISLNDMTGTRCYIAFKYTSTVDAAAAWEVDDIILYTDAQLTPTYTTSTDDLSGFTYAYGNGPSQIMSFSLSASNLIGSANYASVFTTGQYKISIDGETWAHEILLYYENGQLYNQPYTIYVRMNGGLEIGTYLGDVTVLGGGAECRVTLNGEVTSGTGVAESMEENISIYTNDNMLIIKNDSDVNMTMSMFNILGQPIMTKEITTGDNVISHGLATGAYIIRLTDGSNVMTKKIVLR